MAQISIIVPVYNAEKTLERCLNCIQNQIFQDFEAILVNDGSTDRSLEICETYCAKDPRFILINQNNSGPSVARNNAIDAASGEYLAFIDSDDYAEPNFLEAFFTAAKSTDADLTICNYYKHISENNIQKASCKYAPGLYVGDDCRKIAYEAIDVSPFGIRPYSYIRFIKRDCLENPRLRYNPLVYRSEDYLLWTQVFFRINRLCLITDQYLYYYVDNPDSITHRHVKDYWPMVKTLYAELNDALPQEPAVATHLNASIVTRAYIAMNNATRAPSKEVFVNELNAVLKDDLLIRIVKSHPLSQVAKKELPYFMLLKYRLLWVFRIVYTKKFNQAHMH